MLMGERACMHLALLLFGLCVASISFRQKHNAAEEAWP